MCNMLGMFRLCGEREEEEGEGEEQGGVEVRLRRLTARLEAGGGVVLDLKGVAVLKLMNSKKEGEEEGGKDGAVKLKKRWSQLCTRAATSLRFVAHV